MFKQLLFLAVALAVVSARPETFDDQIDARCPPDLSHFLLPHEWDCTRFYYCEYGVKRPQPRDCAPGTDFSFELQVCIHPELANCELPNVPPTEAETEAPTTLPPTTTTEKVITTEEPTTTTTEKVTTTEEPTTTTTEKVTTTEEPTTTTTEKITTTEEPTTTTTEKVTTTTTEKVTTTEEPTTTTTEKVTTTEEPTTTTTEKVTTTEEPTTTTTEKVTTTEEPTTTTTEKVTTTEEPTTTTTEKVTTTEEPTTTTTTEKVTTEVTTEAPTTPEEEREIEWLPNGCPADFSIHHLLPHETECELFYYCVHGEVVLRECNPGLHFNAKLMVCDWPENAGCEPREEEEEEEDQNRCKDVCHIGYWAHEDCDKFWRCEGENEVLGVCAEGLHFNEETKTCDFICNANCVRDTVQVTRANYGVRIFVPADSSVQSIVEAVRKAL